MNICCSVNKYVIFVFNFIFALIGIGLIVAGAILQFNLDYFDEIFGDLQYEIASIILISAGAAIFIVSFLGCCGAVREKSCILTTYTIFLGLIAALLVVGAVFAFMYAVEADQDEVIKTNLEELVDTYYESEASQTAMDEIQEFFECCGVEGPQDWNGTIPDSCSCKDGPEDCVYNKGCYEVVTDFVILLEYILGGIAAGGFAVAIVAIFMTCLLTGAIKKNRHSLV